MGPEGGGGVNKAVVQCTLNLFMYWLHIQKKFESFLYYFKEINYKTLLSEVTPLKKNGFLIHFWWNSLDE
jgi:hypothetical protein